MLSAALSCLARAAARRNCASLSSTTKAIATSTSSTSSSAATSTPRLAPSHSRTFATSPATPPGLQPPRRRPDPRHQGRSKEQGIYLAALVLGMVGATYGAVPLYRLFCQATGFGGTVRSGATVEEKLSARRKARREALEKSGGVEGEGPRTHREITVTFNADVADGLPWRFSPAQRAVVVRPGQSALAFFTARNLGERAVTGVSTYNVAPQQAGAHFNKVQCFCFEEQRLQPGESVDMPVLFYVDPEIDEDPRLAGIDTVTLSYTFFLVDDGKEVGGREKEEGAATAAKAAAAKEE